MRAADSRPCKGNRSLIPYPSRATARAAPAALRKPCLKSGGRVLSLSLLFVGAGSQTGPRAHTVRPYGGKRTRSVGSETQAQTRDRSSFDFLKTQAPSGAGRDRTQALLIPRAGRILPTPRGNPRKWGPGKGGYEHEVLIEAVPGGVLVPLPPRAKELAARRRRNPPAYNEPIRNLSPHPSRFA